MGNIEYYYHSGSEVTREEYVEEMLKRIGKAVFVKYYYEFKREDSSYFEFMTEDYSPGSKKRRAGCAVSLFRQELNGDALSNVAASQRVDEKTRRLARYVYSCEFGTVMK